MTVIGLAEAGGTDAGIVRAWPAIAGIAATGPLAPFVHAARARAASEGRRLGARL